MFPYQFRETYYPSPGTGNFAFVPNFGLPPQAIMGGGNLTRQQIAIMNRNQAISVPTIPVNGLGGLQHGQIIQQSLHRDI